jgi:NarL family two-component system response regulator LiaR
MADDAITILLVEDHEITRVGIRIMLEQMSDIILLGEASSGVEAVSKAKELRPSLVLMDIGLPDMDGIEATRVIKDTLSAKVILITSHDNNEDVLAGLSAGADAYCLKGINEIQLSNAIRSVMDGALWLDPDIAKRIVQLMQPQDNQTVRTATKAENPFHLSEREHQVLRLLVDGNSNQQIADAMYLSTETVKSHMRHLMEKLKVADRTQAAVKAVREGLI